MAIRLSRVNQGTASVRLALWACAVAILLAATATRASAAPGDLDPTFGGGDGLVSTAFDDESQAWAVAVQPSGKIVVAGGREDFDVARFNPDGTPDGEFSDDGKLTTDFGYEDEGVTAVAIQPDGKIVLAGEAGPFFALARYNADGTPDTSFSGDGKVTTDFPETDLDAANALVLQPNGKLVAAGVAWPDIDSPRRIALARYDDDGSLDTDFGEDENGLVVTSFPPKSEGDVANALLRRPNGKLIAVGTVHDYPNGIGKGNVGLVQYNADGSLDTGFGGGDGMVSEHSVTQATSAALAPNGQIAVAGGWEYFLAGRFNSDGSVDTGFDGAGALFPGWHGTGQPAYAVQVQSDGKVVAAGSVSDEFTGETDFAVVRFDTEGELDGSFGVGGIVTTDFEESADRGNAMALQPDGQIVVAGGTEGDFAVARYEGNKPVPPSPGQPASEPPPSGGGASGDDLAKTPPQAQHRKAGAKRIPRKCRKLKTRRARRRCARKHSAHADAHGTHRGSLALLLAPHTPHQALDLE